MMKNKNWLDILLIIILSVFFSISIAWNSNFGGGIVLFIIIFIILYILWDKLNNIKIHKPKEKFLKKELILYGIVIFICLLIAFIIYYPTNLSSDVISQWGQAQSGKYNNWHPVMQTLFSFKLPSLIFNNILFATIFQQCIIMGILLYFCYFLRKNFLSFKWTLIILLLTVLNPLFLKFSVTLLKDTIFSYCLFLETLFVINIVLSDGMWLKKHVNKFFFIIVAFGILNFRHNGIVPFFFLFLSLFIFYPNLRKFIGIGFFTTLICTLIITNPVYKHFNIYEKTGGKSEMIGVILSNISYYYNNDAKFTEEELHIMDTIIPLENWQKYYNPRNFNKTKWSNVYFTPSADANFKSIIKLWVIKTLEHPIMFIESFINITSPIWENRLTYPTVDYKYENLENEDFPRGKIGNVSDTLFKGLIVYNKVTTYTPLRLLFVNIGEGLSIIILALFVIIKRCKFDFKKYLPFVMTLTNTAIIMLLITGEEYRFVYYQTLCALPLLIYSFSNLSKKSKL